MSSPETTAGSAGTSRRKLGVGRLIGESFSVFANNFIALAALAFIPAFIIELIDMWYFAPRMETAFSMAAGLWLLSCQASMNIVGSAIATALIVRLVYDVKSGQRTQIRRYYLSTAIIIVPLIICSFIAGLALIAGLAVLIVPGLYINAIWCCITPAIVVEHAGYTCFRRSAELTSGYRWPCVGLFSLLFVCILLIDAAAIFMADGLGRTTGPAASILLMTLIQGAVMSFSAIVIALVYARLREIKEGASLYELAEIFA